MAKTYLEYRKLLQSLLPKGAFWTRAEDSTLTELLNAFGDELARVEQRGIDLIDEAFSDTITELLEEWEEDFDLPPAGFDLASTTEGRRNDISAKIIAVGQQNKEYFEEIAEALGYTITITEFEKSLVGIITIGDSIIASERCVFFWIVNVWIENNEDDFDPCPWYPFSFSRDFDNSFANAYDVRGYRVNNNNIESLMYNIRLRKPGHTHILFRFYNVEFSNAFDNSFRALPWWDGSWWPLSFSSEFSNDFANNSDYDGVRLTGGFSSAFSEAFDSYRGGDFHFDQFGDGFLKPT